MKPHSPGLDDMVKLVQMWLITVIKQRKPKKKGKEKEKRKGKKKEVLAFSLQAEVGVHRV